MRQQFLAAMGALALVVALLQLAPVTFEGQTSRGTPPAANVGPAPKTPWGEPDLQGIWTYEFQVPFERNPKYANREFFTDEEIKEFDRQRAAQQSRDYRAERGSEADVSGAYNAVFLTVKRSGRRTSMVVDPPTGKSRRPRRSSRSNRPRTARSRSRSWRQPKHVSSNWPAAPAGSTIRNRRLGETRCLRATSPMPSIAIMALRTEAWASGAC